MELIEEEGADAFQIGIPQHLPDKNPLGDKEEAGCGAGGIIQPDAVAYLVADPAIAFLGHTGGEHASGKSSWLKDDGATRTQNSRIEKHLGYLRRFSRTRGSFHDQAVAAGQFGDDSFAKLLDR